MFSNRIKKCCLVTNFLLATSLFAISSSANDDLNTSDLFSKNTSQIVELRGYIAINHYVTNKDGYIINLVEVRNPKINNGESIGPKEPILFVHGTLVSGSFFIINSVGARPKNYAHLDAGSMGDGDLMKLLANDPTSNSLPFTASNFGHPVFIENRRGTSQSQGHISRDTQPYKNPLINGIDAAIGGLLPPSPPKSGRKKRQVNLEIEQPFQVLANLLLTPALDLSHLENIVNPRYWNFSLDEQVNDLSEIMDYIIELTGREKLSLVTHSAGGALALMLLADHPEISNKIIKSINWAPALYPNTLRTLIFGGIAGPILMTYIGPVPPSQILPFLNNIVSAICSFQLVMDTLCESVEGLILGYAGDQQILYPGITREFFDSFSSHSLAQLIQAGYKGKMYHYDYIKPSYNLKAYGQPNAPLYDVSRITSKTITFWVGNTDGFVTLANVERLMRDMSVPVKLFYIDQPGLAFNHNSFSLHKNVSRLVVIPSLKEIESP